MDEKNTHSKPYKDVRYREIAYRAIRDAILSGQLEAEKPLIEEALAEMLNISRTPVREALIILEHEDLIGPRHGRGLYVRPITRAEFVEVFTSNEIVTLELARRAARLVTEEQLHALGDEVSREIYYAGQGELPNFLFASRQFLYRLGEAAENAPLANFLINSQERIDIYLLSMGSNIPTENVEALAHQHESVMNALVRHDPDEAGRLVNYHAQWMRERFAGFFKETSEEGIEPVNLADF
jgi:DNA-binding GntR family transcriptional regulator